MRNPNLKPVRDGYIRSSRVATNSNRQIKIGGPTYKRLLESLRMRELERIAKMPSKTHRKSIRKLDRKIEKLKRLQKREVKKQRQKKKKSKIFQCTVSVYRKLVDEEKNANHRGTKMKRFTMVNGIRYRQVSRKTVTIKHDPTRWAEDGYYIIKREKKDANDETAPQYTDAWKNTAHFFGILHDDVNWEHYYDQYQDYIDMVRLPSDIVH